MKNPLIEIRSIEDVKNLPDININSCDYTGNSIHVVIYGKIDDNFNVVHILIVDYPDKSATKCKVVYTICDKNKNVLMEFFTINALKALCWEKPVPLKSLFSFKEKENKVLFNGAQIKLEIQL